MPPTAPPPTITLTSTSAVTATLIPASSPASYQIGPGDAAMMRQEAFIDSVRVQISTDHPPVVMVILAGYLPTPCNKLRVVTAPIELKNQINLKVYSVYQAGQVCIQQINPYRVAIPLKKTGNDGEYHLLVNNKEALTFYW